MGRVTIEELREAVASGRIDTVVLGFADMQGRLQGKRFTAGHFLDAVLDHGSEACNYLLAVDVEMNPAPGYEMASWERGYGDFETVPDLSTLRETPWNEGAALILADLLWHDHSPVLASPRQVLRAQLERLSERGWSALAATELEFIVFDESYREASAADYQGLTPANHYNLDYSILGGSYVEPLIRRIRNEMTAAGMVVENSKGECNLGQHEVNFRYADALATADDHVVYKTGAKEIAVQEGMAITFMAKYDEREGNSCHVHFSLRDGSGSPVFADSPELFDSFLSGVLASLRELTLFHAPHVNSYKRFAEGSFAPTTVAWGNDNRTCSVRVIGDGMARRLELRCPGADVNPYLSLAAIIAAGLDGIDRGLPATAPLEGNAYAADAERLPVTLREGQELFAGSSLARSAFGDEVVDHYVNCAQVELDAFNSTVTDWELRRGFERF
ncbi:MAG: glutamine synthetase family protein [Solirubrobacterales bacterium]